MFDFNYDIKTSLKDFEGLEYVSSINVGAFSCKLLEEVSNYASKNEISLSALISSDVVWESQDIKANVLWQLSTIEGFFSSYDLKLENVRLSGVIEEKLNSDKDFALNVALAIKHYNPWLNLIIKNHEIKEYIENNTKIKCALEVDFNENSSIREIRELEHTPNTLHFEDTKSLARAYDVIKPTPINYNRVAEEL